MLNIQDGNEVEKIDIYPRFGGYRGPIFYDLDSRYSTKKHLLSLVYGGREKDRKGRKEEICKSHGFLFTMLDLDTLECKAHNIGMQGINTAKIMGIFNKGKLASVLLDGDLYFFNLTLSNPKEVFERRSKIRTNAENFEEVCDGFCITEYPDSFWAKEEYMTLKAETLSKPLQTWLNLLQEGKI